MFKNKKAFTLMEMLVATAIFAIVMVIYAGIYISSVRVNAKMIANQKVQNEIRYVMELMSREIRLGSINYSFYTSKIQDPENILAINDELNSSIFFRAYDGAFQVAYNTTSTWSNISTPNIKVNELYFFITPKENPLLFSSMDDRRQQGVMIYLDANFNKDSQMDGLVRLQTFVSSRQYKQ